MKPYSKSSTIYKRKKYIHPWKTPIVSLSTKQKDAKNFICNNPIKASILHRFPLSNEFTNREGARKRTIIKIVQKDVCVSEV